MLQKNGHIESDLSLREVYNKYFHPDVLPLDDEATWKSIKSNTVLNLFQFDSDSGSQGIKKVQPSNIQELADTNGLIRLMAGEGEELPLDKYARHKQNHPTLWIKEMEKYGLTKEEQKNVAPYFEPYYGVPISQEVLMQMVMDKHLCGFTLKEANELRKVLAKKQLQQIPVMKEKILSRATSPAVGHYVWTCGAMPQMSYSFSVLHATAYSYIGFQTAYLATHWDPIYWNTACLIVNSGSLEEEEDNEEIVGIYEKEDPDYEYEDLPDRSGKKKIDKTTDYGKMAQAIGDIMSRGIKVSLIDINKSGYSFEPDEKNHEILFGLKGVNKIGSAIIEQIIAGRPYTGIKDFMNRCSLNKTQMVSLIKAGAFDKVDAEWAGRITSEPRYAIMAYYLSIASEPKKRLTLQNLNGLIEKELLPNSLMYEQRTYAFNKYLKKNKSGIYYYMTNDDLEFYGSLYDDEGLEVVNGVPCIEQKTWDKIYQKQMDNVRSWLKEYHDELLEQYNICLFQEVWNKYANSNISAWEMESLCFYYHEHELAHINSPKYGIVDFFKLNPDSEIDYFFKRNGRDIPIYKLSKIAGTIISKNNTKATITILTTNGVVNVKFSKEYYAMFNRQLSEVQEDGSKKIMEKGWFTRGIKVLVTGYRREDTFVAKTYKSTNAHQLYKIIEVKDKDIILEHERMDQIA